MRKESIIYKTLLPEILQILKKNLLECQDGDKTAAQTRDSTVGPYPKRTAQHSQAGLPPSSAGGFLSWGDLTAGCDRDAEPAALGSLLWLVGSFCGPPAGDPMHTVMSTACTFLIFLVILHSAGAMILTQMREGLHKFMVTIIRYFSVSLSCDLADNFSFTTWIQRKRVGQGTCN